MLYDFLSHLLEAVMCFMLGKFRKLANLISSDKKAH